VKIETLKHAQSHRHDKTIFSLPFYTSFAQFHATFFSSCASITLQGILFDGRICVKRTLSLLALVAAPVLVAAAQPQQASASQPAPTAATNAVPAQSSNPASSHDRHNRRHSHGSKRHHHHRSTSAKH